MIDMQNDSSSAMVRLKLRDMGVQEILDLERLTEVAINQPGRIWFDRGNNWEYKDEPRCSFAALESLANALSVYSTSPTGINFKNPIASVILPDAERGQLILPPAAEGGTVSVTIRKPSLTRFNMDDYMSSGRLTQFKEAERNYSDLSPTQKKLLELKKNGDMIEFFRTAIGAKMNILLVGGTGSGKTTIMKALADMYPLDARIFTIEDVHELDLPNHPNHVHLFYKAGGVTPKVLIESCMRMKPDHVFLAELRGDETWGYLELLNTGHPGSITTTHANDCYSAFTRLASLVKQSEVGKTLDYDFILKTIKSSIDIVCFFSHTYMKEIYFNPEEKNEILSGV